MKRLISLFLAVALLMGLPLSASANESFNDINNHWAKSQIQWVADRGLMSGVGGGQFNPTGTVTRGQMVTALYQLAGKPAANALANPFTDVPAGIWYENAVKWGYSKGVVSGTSATTFAPNANVTREQMAILLFYYAKNVAALDVDDRADLTTFPDSGSVHSWAAKEMSWANATGLINGKVINGKKYLSPLDQATRAELAVIVKSYAVYEEEAEAPAPAPTPTPTPQPSTGKHTALPLEQRYHYTNMNTTEREAYMAIHQAISKMETTAVLPPIRFDEVGELFRRYMDDHPDRFYVSDNLYGVSQSGKNVTLQMCFTDGKNSNQLGRPLSTELKASINQNIATFESTVEMILAEIPANLPLVEKEKMIYDRLQKNARYDLNAAQTITNPYLAAVHHSWNAYGVMVLGTGVCESYAEAFETLLFEVGINNTSITGKAGGGNHKWSAVQLDNEWYACDITFDDPIFIDEAGQVDPDIYIPSYRFFNLTTQQMASREQHIVCETFVPNCTGTKYSYDNYFKS